MSGRGNRVLHGLRASFLIHGLSVFPADSTEEFAVNPTIYYNLDLITVDSILQYYKKRRQQNDCGSYDQVKDRYGTIDIYSITGFPGRSAIINEYYYYRRILYQGNYLFNADFPSANIYRNGKIFCSFPTLNPIYGFCVIDDYAIALCYELKTAYSIATYFDRELKLSISGESYTNLGACYDLIAYRYHLINGIPEKDDEGNTIPPEKCATNYSDVNLIGMRTPWSFSENGASFAHVDYLSRYLYRGTLSGIEFNAIEKTELAQPVVNTTTNSSTGSNAPSALATFYLSFGQVINNEQWTHNGSIIQKTYKDIDGNLTGERSWEGTISSTGTGYFNVLSYSNIINDGYANFCYALTKLLNEYGQPAVIDTIDVSISVSGSFSGSAINWNSQIVGTLSVTISYTSRLFGSMASQTYSQYMDLVSGTDNTTQFSGLSADFVSGYLVGGAGNGKMVSGSVNFDISYNVTSSFASAIYTSGYPGGVTINKGDYWESTVSNAYFIIAPYVQLRQRGSPATSFEYAFKPQSTVILYQYPIEGLYSGFEFSESNTYGSSSTESEEASCIIGVDYINNTEKQLKVNTTRSTETAVISTIQYSAQPNDDFTDFTAQSTSTGTRTITQYKKYDLLEDNEIIYNNEYTYSSSTTSTIISTILEQGEISYNFTYLGNIYQHAPLFIDIRHGIYWLLQTKYNGSTPIESKLISILPLQTSEEIVDHTKSGMIAVERSFLFNRGDSINRRIFIPCGGYGSIFSAATLTKINSSIDSSWYHHHGYTLTSYQMNTILWTTRASVNLSNFNNARFELSIGSIFCAEDTDNKTSLISFYPDEKQIVLDNDGNEVERNVNSFFPIRVI